MRLEKNPSENVKEGKMQELLKIKVTTLLVRMVYPVIVSYFLQNGKEAAIESVENVAQDTVEEFLRYYKPKENKLSKLLPNLMKLWGPKYKIIRDKKNRQKLILRTNKCPICEEMPPMDLFGLKYCFIISVFIEKLLNALIKIKNPQEFEYTNFSAETTKSVGNMDEYCEIILKFEK
ncbi:MAG: hypothetical protein GF329_22125 [Candidatus Lokiarchaeota archaeon]|nr:hypothetical protein [Candidatus Lokiarchaeota archaeon]